MKKLPANWPYLLTHPHNSGFTKDVMKSKATTQELEQDKKTRDMILAQHPIPRKTSFLTLEDRRTFCAIPVTLDGKRAKISGARNKFATVHAFADNSQGNWAWETVWAIVTDRNGEFYL